jgi:hypothetical protein
MEAKGIFERQKLRVEDLNKIDPRNKLGNQIKEFKYDKSKDYKAVKDLFEPISTPSSEYLRLPVSIKMEFIDSEDSISMLEDLKGQKYIGVDAEWRPQIHKWQTNKGPATLQIAGKDEAFIIDILKLSKSKKLDNMLSSIFSHK